MTKDQLLENIITIKNNNNNENFKEILNLVEARVSLISDNSLYKNMLSDLNNQISTFSNNSTNSAHAKNVLVELNNLPSPTSKNEIDDLFKKAKKKLEEVEKEISKQNSTIDDHSIRLQDQLDNIDGFVKDSEEGKKKIDTLVRGASDTALAGHYEETASELQKKSVEYRSSAKLWLNFAAIAAFLVLGSTIAITYFKEDYSVSFMAALFKMVGSFVIMAPGAYMAWESTRLFKEAVRSRRIAHELTTMDTFFQGLDDEKQEALRVLLATKYFGNADNIYSKQLDGEMDIEDILKSILKPDTDKEEVEE